MTSSGHAAGTVLVSSINVPMIRFLSEWLLGTRQSMDYNVLQQSLANLV